MERLMNFFSWPLNVSSIAQYHLRKSYLAKVFLLMAMMALSQLSFAVQITYTENTSSTDELALGYPVPLPVDSQTPVDGFRSYDSLMARHQDLALSSNYITGAIVGQTIEGENIWAYALSDADDFTSDGVSLEASMLQNGGIHAREWQSPEVVTGIMERFFDNQNDQGFYQYLLENNKIVLIPVLNISGFRQTQRYPINAIRSTDQDDSNNTPRDGRMRRKNMRSVDTDLASENDFLNGVDLNRNNNPYWSTSAPQRSSFRTTSIVHHGNGPASEPETQALQQAAVLAGESRLRFYIDTHSFTRIYFTPMTGNSRRDAITESVANRMRAVNNNRYDYGPSNAGGGIGATDEYFANTYQIPSYTLEIEPGQGGGTDYGGFGVSHDGFILPDSEIARVRNELADASILGYYLQAGPPSVERVVITRSDNADVVFDGQWVATSTTTREWQTTTNTGLSASQTYDFWVNFNKPMRTRNNGIIGNFPGQNVNATPQITLEGFDASGDAFAQVLSTAQGIWLNNSGSAPDGFSHYADDAFKFEFQLAANTPIAGASLVQIAITTTDLAEQNLDASPATIIDWSNGSWAGYESTNGQLADSGGTDRTIRLVDDGSAGFVQPTSPADQPTSSSSGGGVFNYWLLAFMALVATSRFYFTEKHVTKTSV